MGARAPAGLLLAAVGAVVVVVATFHPWYAVRITPAGAVAAPQQLTPGTQHANSAFQSLANEIGSPFRAVAGRRVGTLSAHQSMRRMSTLLLVLAGVALAVSLWRLAGMIEGGGGFVAFFGVVAALCVGYRMVVTPNPAGAYFSLSLSWGSWLALLGATAVACGGMWSPPEEMRRLSRRG